MNNLVETFTLVSGYDHKTVSTFRKFTIEDIKHIRGEQYIIDKRGEYRRCRPNVLIAARKSIETSSGLFDIMCRMDGKLKQPTSITRIQSSIAITVAIRSNRPTVKNKNNFYLTKLFLLDRLINRRMQ